MIIVKKKGSLITKKQIEKMCSTFMSMIRSYYEKGKLEKCTADDAIILSFDGQKKVCKVISVYDGDTCTLAFFFGGKIYQWKCRLYGINAPEIRTKDINEKTRGLNAKNYLTSKIEGRLVDVEFKNFEKYGRLLGTIYLCGENINEDMVQKEFAVRYMVED